jgi:osmotically inducible protein OsmC
MPMAAVRTAEVSWSGDLASGNGLILYVSSGAIARLPVSWAARTEAHGGKTSPEELLAAAHASCFSMALSHGLAQDGHPPDRLNVKATSTFVPGTGITAMKLDVTGRVQGMSEEEFRAAAQNAAENCPVSQALKGNVDISVDAHLDTA